MTGQPGPIVCLEENHDIPLVELLLVTRTGSAGDPVGREGALGVAMRSLRRGAGDRKAFAIEEQIDRLGAGFSASAGATTTTIHATVIRRNLEPFLDLLADLALRPTFPESEVAQVIRETRADIIDSRNDDRTLAARYFRRTLFAGHAYGRPSLGTLKSLESLSREDIVTEFNRTMTAPNLVIGAAGDISQDELDRMVEQRLGTVSRATATSTEIAEPTPRKGRHLVIVDKPERTQTQISIGRLGTRIRDRDHTALHVANTIFGGTFTSRLSDEVRTKRGWSYGVSSRLDSDRVRGAWSMWTHPAATDAVACIALELKLLEELLDKGISEKELSFAKKYLVRSYAFEIDTAAKRLGQRLDEIVMELPKGYFRDYTKRVEAVTRDEANAALRKRLSSDDLLISIVATESALRSQLEKGIPGLKSTRVIPFDRDEVVTL